MRIFLKIIAIACTASLTLVGGTYAQSKKPETKGAASKKTGSKKTKAKESEAKQKKPKLSADQMELDKQLLGAWAMVTSDGDAEITDELFRKAVLSCGATPFVTGIDVEPGLKNALPDKKQIRGHLVYFRTEQGLQRYETNPSRVLLLPEIRKAANAQGRTIWQVAGKFAQFPIAFAGAQRGVNALLMLEGNRLFLKCESQPQTDG